jgi:hypothetical protein
MTSGTAQSLSVSARMSPHLVASISSFMANTARQ